MRKLTQDEFNDRMIAIAEAKRIFVDSGITNNITLAFEMYQDILADKERPLQLDSKEQGADKAPSFSPPTITLPLDIELEKPQCPDCGDPMTLREATEDEKKEGFRSAWICKKCRYEGLSEKSTMRWIRELPEKGEEEVTVEGRTEKEDVPRG